MLNCRIIHCESVINVQSKENGATIFGLAMKFGLSRATRKKLKFGSKNSERVKQKTNKKKKRDELMNIKSLSVKSWHDGCPNKVPQCDSITLLAASEKFRPRNLHACIIHFSQLFSKNPCHKARILRHSEEYVLWTQG